MITRLNPKPGGTSDGLIKTQYIIPDFILTNVNGKFEISLNSKNAPELRVSRSYSEMFDAYDKSDKKDKKLKDTVTFVKQKLDAGASLVQIYTGLIYQGPKLIADCVRAFP